MTVTNDFYLRKVLAQVRFMLFVAGIEMKRWFSGGDKGQGDSLSMSKQKEAALQLQLAERNLENLALRQQAHANIQQARPQIAQVIPQETLRLFFNIISGLAAGFILSRNLRLVSSRLCHLPSQPFIE